MDTVGKSLKKNQSTLIKLIKISLKNNWKMPNTLACEVFGYVWLDSVKLFLHLYLLSAKIIC